ncbi:heptaprenylglyceryl phosphate synthase [Paenibacillus humicola]|uniref:heptaprenylglyceryl phosphate synthase n=1 Tax=Paenibacillus humicola TaxID=3110540 RepID=UPI00237A9C49|nr:heptaprenylglyceryl phosphate synthase [Paenibacillus humicola]
MKPAIYENWRHAFKLDPDKELSDEALEAVCTSGTDAVIVGGSSGVTYDNTNELLSRIRRYPVPCALEASSGEAAVPGFDYYFIPLVLNGEAEWLVRRQLEALRLYGVFIPWEQTAAEGYVILNGASEAARRTGAETELDAEQIEAIVRMADRLMRLPILYIEYSGVFGDMERLGRIRELLTGARLFYGGGIDGPEKARAAAAWAHTVIVGNAVYDKLNEALSTVAAVKENID